MFKKFLTWLIVLPVTLLFAQCAIDNDIPYPFIEAAITTIEVEGQCNATGTGFGSAVINNDNHTVQLYVDDTVDLSRLCVKRLEVSNNATITVDNAVCVNPGSFPTQSFKETSNPEATRLNFTNDVQFKLTTYQDYIWTVHVSQIIRSEVSVFPRCVSAILSGSVKNGVVPGVEYREQGTQDWQTLPASQITANADEYKAEVTGLVPGTTYEYRMKYGAVATEVATFTTAPAQQLPNSSFDDWCSSGTGTKVLWMPWAEGETGYWDTGNRGATTVGASNSTCVTEDGRTFANLQSKYIVLKFAAGNIFTGQYLATDGTNGILSFGREFNTFPSKLQFDYKYTSSTINRTAGAWNNAYGEYISKGMYNQLKGQPDSCQIYIALLDDYVDDADRDANTYDGKVYPWIIRTSPKSLHLFKADSPRVIAYGQLTQGNSTDGWKTEEIELNYRYTDRTPKYIMVVASSSKYGDYFTGGDASLLQLDNVKLLYE